MKIQTSILVGGALALCFTFPLAGPNGNGRSAQILHQYTLPRLSLTKFGYSQAELDAARPNGLIVSDRPGFGSGLEHVHGDFFIGVTDRGPNIDHFPVDALCAATSSSADGKTYPLPQFTPAIVLFRATGNGLFVDKVLNLVDGNGAPVTGLSNDDSDDKPFGSPCETSPLPFNPNGMDVEDIHTLPGGRFIGVEENKPSVFVGQLATGVVEKRYTPSGKPLSGATYAVSELFPAILTQRRNNRGFESLAVTPDGGTAYVATQSPLGSTSSGSPYRDSRVLRVFRLDVRDPLIVKITGQFVVVMSPVSAYPAGNRQRDLKLSAMSWVTDDKLLLLERSDEVDKGGVRLLLVDLSGATDISHLATADSLDIEDVNQGPSSLGITTATSAVVFEEFETDAKRFFPAYKLEGLAILNKNEVAIINDNDFGIAGVPDAATQLWVLRLASQLP
jgi:alkaline phosphatase